MVSWNEQLRTWHLRRHRHRPVHERGCRACPRPPFSKQFSVANPGDICSRETFMYAEWEMSNQCLILYYWTITKHLYVCTSQQIFIHKMVINAIWKSSIHLLLLWGLALSWYCVPLPQFCCTLPCCRCQWWLHPGLSMKAYIQYPHPFPDTPRRASLKNRSNKDTIVHSPS